MKDHPRVLGIAVVIHSKGLVVGIIVIHYQIINLAALAHYWYNNRKLVSLETSSEIEKGNKTRAGHH